MKIEKTNIVTQYELVKEYVDKYGGEWNDACDIVSNWDDGNRYYYLFEIEQDIEADEASGLKIFLKEIMEENKIDQIYLSRN